MKLRRNALLRMIEPLALSCACMATPTAAAQWTVINLHPEGATMSRAHGIDAGEQVGEARFGNVIHASRWLGSAASWVSLHPEGATLSQAYGVSDGVQVGRTSIDEDLPIASVWNGSARTWIGLATPQLGEPGDLEYVSYANDNGTFIGTAQPGAGNWHGVMWLGTEGTFVDLTPPGAEASAAFGGGDGQQVGRVSMNDQFRAALWTGSAESFVDLGPGEARAARNGVQVGALGFAQAALWTGTADSIVNLHIPAATTSYAWNVFGDQQVGQVVINGKFHASLWHGSADTWVDLHECVPPEFSISQARDIWSDGELTYVVGFGFNMSTQREEALMWIGHNQCGCPADINGDSQVNGADLGTLLGVWGGTFPAADINADGEVDGADLGLLLWAWGQCPE
jgi:hypothetical protein